MDEKRPGITASRMLSTPSFARRSRLFSIRRLLLAVLLTCTMWYIYPSLFAQMPLSVLPSAQQEVPQPRPAATAIVKDSQIVIPTPTPTAALASGSTQEANSQYKLSLEAHIMSKCPDARDCLRDLIVPAMSQISPLVDFKLYYIGTLSPDSNTVTCKHGPAECLGNSISLCAQELYSNDTKTSLGFTNCLVRDYKTLPDQGLVQDCALEHRVDFEKVNRCVSEEGRGEELLRRSVVESKSKGVQFSCTVRLEEKIWCVRDSGEWKECGEHGGSVTALVDEVKKRSGDGQ